MAIPRRLVSDSACEFQTNGYFEEFIDADTGKFLGIRYVQEPDRALGSDGRVTYDLTAPLDLLKGYKRTPIKIKPPRKVTAMLQAICGRRK